MKPPQTIPAGLAGAAITVGAAPPSRSGPLPTGDGAPPPPLPDAPRSPAARRSRLAAIDRLRGTVMVLMTIDHASGAFNHGRLFSDSAMFYHPGAPLPAAQFLTRWITHLCAPTFVFLAGASLALMSERRAQAGERAWSIDRQMLVRGLFIMALDPLWMSLGFFAWARILFQVLYAIGLSMVCMAALRRLPSWALIGAALAMIVGVDLLVSARLAASAAGPGPGAVAVAVQSGAPPLPVGLLVSGGRYGFLLVAYPLASWLAIMMLGFAFGRWAWRRGRAIPPLPVALAGLASLALFVVLRGLDGFGNMGLHRYGGSLVQWLHVSKYPPSVTFCTLELGLMALLLSAFAAVGRGSGPRWMGPLEVLGGAAMLFYLLHVHLLEGASFLLGLHGKLGLGATYAATAVCVAVLYPVCSRYVGYKTTHGNWVTRLV